MLSLLRSKPRRKNVSRDGSTKYYFFFHSFFLALCVPAAGVRFRSHPCTPSDQGEPWNPRIRFNGYGHQVACVSKKYACSTQGSEPLFFWPQATWWRHIRLFGFLLRIKLRRTGKAPAKLGRKLWGFIFFLEGRVGCLSAVACRYL